MLLSYYRFKYSTNAVELNVQYFPQVAEKGDGHGTLNFISIIR